MSKKYYVKSELPESALWDKKQKSNSLFSFTLEVTARCNNNCRHCFVNLAEDDLSAKKAELTLSEIKNIVDQAVELGAVWCLLTGGEPLLRSDFEEIYLYIKRKGLLVTLFTNATLITQKHVDLFKKYPPRDIEVTVYGVTERTYAAVTRKAKQFKAFMDGVNLLYENGIGVNLKNVVIKANLHEFDEISDFCRKYTKMPFRFDPQLHLRFDRDVVRNKEIREQRLSAKEIGYLEKTDDIRMSELEKSCDLYILEETIGDEDPYLFTCGAGLHDFMVRYDGLFCLCSSLTHPEYTYDLKSGLVKDAIESLVPKVRALKSNREEYRNKCGKCKIINLCIWCPAHSYLESGEMDMPSEYFCDVANIRSKNITPA